MINKIFVVTMFAIFATVATARPEEILTWGECLKLAKENNPDLISAAESIDAQKAAKSIVASRVFPQISADLDYSKSKVASASVTKSYSYGLSGTQLIFDGLKSIYDIKASSDTIEATRQAYRFTSSTVRFDLRSAFINLLKAQKLIEVATEIVRIRRDNLVLVTMQYESGLQHRGAKLTAEANMEEASFELAQAKRNLDFARRSLSAAMGFKDYKPISVKGEFTVLDTAENKPPLDTLAQSTPLVLKAAAEKNSASFSVKSARADFFPQFSFSGATSKNGSRWPPRRSQWNYGVSMTAPLFEGGLKSAQLSEANALFRQAEAKEKSALNSAIVDLEQHWASLRDAVESVSVSNKLLLASEERSKIAEAEYSAGFITFDNWIIIENDYVAAQKNYLQSEADALLAEANWILSKGETLDYAQ